MYHLGVVTHFPCHVLSTEVYRLPNGTQMYTDPLSWFWFLIFNVLLSNIKLCNK